ncbi:hypothetical protein [Haloglycomyces albus]|uniref:hypothetical protein n=1 Tax=Haloglycomyces albus TaxID=526067 RepID=UPI0012EB4AE0|nr:hypothetical protein [Haloglycomyces albus]
MVIDFDLSWMTHTDVGIDRVGHDGQRVVGLVEQIVTAWLSSTANDSRVHLDVSPLSA